MFKKDIPHEQQMLLFGTMISKYCGLQAIIFLQGDLGAGKTTLVRGFLQGIGHTGIVKSPTYSLVESYEINNYKIFHFDLYRINDPHELDYMGIQDYFEQKAILLIEWPEKAEDWLPPADLSCYINLSEKGRNLVLQASTPRGNEILQQIKNNEANL